jgi:hypothetical protein
VPAYVTIVLLQLKVIWGMWAVRDLTTGDTSGYFTYAQAWQAEGLHNLVWSPLYLIYYGSFLTWTQDAYVATIAHRVTLILIVAVLVLALMRRLLEPRIAWLVSAWWVVQPINHDVLYEVHLFGVLPVVLAGLVLLGPPSPWRPGLGLGVLLAGCLLVRNELLIPVALLFAACVVYEARRRARHAESPEAMRRRWLLAYGGPMVACALTVGFVYARSDYIPGAFRSSLATKHTLNVCQIYAFGYQQRHDDWQKSPWTDCQELMTTTFGRPLLTMTAAFRANPSAMLEHVGWNASLIPNGLQLLLFGRTSGSVQPGYEPILGGSTLALGLSIVTVFFCLIGTALILRDWSYWSTWLRPRLWGWVLLASVAAGSVVVMLMQRPRPAYLFSLELGLLAFIGLCAQAWLRKSQGHRRFETVFPLLQVLLLILVPRFYDSSVRPAERPLRDMYLALFPYRAAIQAPETVIVTPGFGGEICNYLTARPGLQCRSLDYHRLRPEAEASGDWWSVLAAHGANMIYVNEAVAAEPLMRRSLARAKEAGWETVMWKPTKLGDRMLLRRRSPHTVTHRRTSSNCVVCAMAGDFDLPRI